jgi:hypothetical protein
MKQQKVINHGKNIKVIECKDTISTAEVSAYISYGEILEIEEGDWKSMETLFKRDDEESSNGTVQEAMALLVKDWPQFYCKVKRYSTEDKLWSVAKAEDFAREEEIKDLTQRIDNLTEELNALSKKRRRLQGPKKR